MKKEILDALAACLKASVAPPRWSMSIKVNSKFNLVAELSFPRLFVFQERVFMLPVFPVVEC